MESEQTTERAAGNRITDSKDRTKQAVRSWAAPMHVRRPRSPKPVPGPSRGEYLALVACAPCRGERPSDGPDRQEEREEVTGGTHCAGKGPGRDGIARRSQKSASDRSASGRADHRGPAAAPTRQRDGLAASPPPYAGPSRGLTGPSVAGAKPVESERTGTLVGALVARRRSRVAIRPAPAGGE